MVTTKDGEGMGDAMDIGPWELLAQVDVHAGTLLPASQGGISGPQSPYRYLIPRLLETSAASQYSPDPDQTSPLFVAQDPTAPIE